jgi:hypothetical protein
MQTLKNERGIALVLVLILALISLAMVSSLLYMATMGTRASGAEKFYRTADDAAFGGTRIAVDMIVNNFDNAVAGGALSAPFAATLGSVLNVNQPCLRQKFSLSPGAGFANWAACNANERNLDAADTPDMTFQLSGVTTDGMPNPFNVVAKVVDTIEGNTSGVASSSSTSGLSTGGVGGGGAAIVTPQRQSWMYRIEVEAEDSVNQQERSRYSVLFAH